MDVALMSFSFFALYHSAVLSSMALFHGQNLNYLLMPPPGPLQWFGRWYRPVMYAFCVFLTMSRYFLVELVIQWLPRRNVNGEYGVQAMVSPKTLLSSKKLASGKGGNDNSSNKRKIL